MWRSKRFTLSRYHDFNYSQSGPGALAKFLGLAVDEVFPISYNITPYSTGDLQTLKGKILKRPREKLSREQLIAMATT